MLVDPFDQLHSLTELGKLQLVAWRIVHSGMSCTKSYRFVPFRLYLTMD